MQTLIRMLHDEPILLSNVIKALIGVLAAFGLILSGAQVAAIVALVAAVLVVAVAFIERQQVTPVNKGRRKR